MLFFLRSARRAAAGAVGTGLVVGTILLGPAPLAQADPTPAPAPPAHCTVDPSCTPGAAPQSPQPPPAAGYPLGARGLAIRLPIRLGLLPLRLGRFAWRL